MAETDSGFSELQDGDFPLRYVYRCLPVSTSSCSYRFPVNFPFSRRFSYGFHLIFPLSCGLSYGYPLIFSIFLWVFLWILSIFPLVSPWVSYGFIHMGLAATLKPMEQVRNNDDSPWFHGGLMVF